MATSTELLRAAEHMRSQDKTIAEREAHDEFGRSQVAYWVRNMADALEREAKRLQAVEATSHRGGAAYMSDLREDERQAVIDSMGSGFAPGSPRGWRDGRVAFSHLIDPTTRATRCAGYMYHGDSMAIDCEPTCPGCLQWRSQNRSWPEGWPPFAVLRRAYASVGVPARPSTLWCERHGGAVVVAYATSVRRRWEDAVRHISQDPSSP